MEDSANTQQDEEFNIPEETSSTVISTIDTSRSSTDTNAVLVRNRLLRNAMKGLKETFDLYKHTMEELIEKPVADLEKQTFNDISADKDTLKKSEKLLKDAVQLLQEGVKTMKAAMFEHSRKIEALCNLDECSNNCSSEDLSKDCQTLKKDTFHFSYKDQDFTGNQDGFRKLSHEEDYMRNSNRALASIRPSQSEEQGFRDDIIRRAETVMGSPYSRYSAYGTPLNPITWISPNNSVESGQILIVGNGRLPSLFGNSRINFSDRPGTSITRARRMPGKHDNFHSRRLSHLSFNPQVHDMSSQTELRGKGMILKGSRSDLRPRTDVGPRRMPDDKRM